MKNSFGKIIFVFMSVLFCVGVFGCTKNDDVNVKTEKKAISEKVSKIATESVAAVLNQPVKKGTITFADMTDFFKPDYSAVVLENVAQNSVAKTGSKKSSDSKKTENVIPGLRKLDSYKTKYSTKKPELYKAEENYDEAELQKEIAQADKTTFTVENWGPQQVVVSESENPVFYVYFSQPVHALSALTEPSETSEIMKIEPQLKGVFRWYGTKMLAFESSQAASPAQKYTISIKSDLKALSGAKLSGQTSFSTKAAELKINNFYAGYMGEGDYYYGWRTGIIPDYASTFYVRLNYQITEDILKNSLAVKIDGQNRTFEVEPDYDTNNFPYSDEKVLCNENQKTSNSFIVKIIGNIPYGKEVNVLLGSQKESYETLKPFILNSVSKMTESSSNGQKNPVYLDFNLPVDEKTISEAISFDFDFEFTENTYKLTGSTLKIFNMPVNKNETHYIKINKNKLKDVYGQSFDNRVMDKYSSDYGKEKSLYEFKVSPAESYAKFLDSGTVMLEAQFPHKILFEYQNIKSGSKYLVSKTTFPLNNYFSSIDDAETIAIEPKEEDVAHFEEIDLDPYLNENGYGFVKFQASILRNRYNEWKQSWQEVEDQNIMNVQVTDLGITARIGINRAVVFVTRLSDGKPVEGAEVQLFKVTNNKLDCTVTLDKRFTDKDGLCVIDYSSAEFYQIKTVKKGFNYKSQIGVKVIKDDDCAMFVPNSHWANQYGISTDFLESAAEEKERTFIFVDRGLYRPGETISFRGIDRTQMLGQLAVPTGNFEIWFTESLWNGKQIGEKLSGSLSDSGGFYGTFKLPDDIKPGTYMLNYSRGLGKEAKAYGGSSQITFTVAEFTTLKFEASTEIPKITYFGGDRINANVSADYLAGGSLSSADYNSVWYSQPVTFAPENPEVRDYTFGPKLDYSPRTYYSDEDGKLSTEGKVSVGCKTSKIKDGKTLSYRISTTVKDITNQAITTNATVMVHPAQFYIGLKRKNSGFEEKGKVLEIDYLLASPDGSQLPVSSVKKAGNLNYKLSHTEWKYVNEKSVYGSVYTRYVSEKVIDEEGSIKLDSASGSVKFTPANAGWYTLEVTGYDSKENLSKTELSFYVSGAGASWYESSENISLTASQNMYNPGDKAQILLQSPLPKGDYLITVEREGIFSQEIRHFESNTTTFEIPISKNYVPVVYVSVSSYSVRKGYPAYQYGEVDLDKPKGYYGAVPLFVNTQVKAFSVKIDCNKPTYKPGEDVEIKLTATKGGLPVKNAELTLMAVDRGVLDLINYHVSNPIDYFYSSSFYPLCVQGGDSRALLMDPVTYSIKNLAGGDAAMAAEESKDEERKDFRPTAVFEPVLVTDENGQAVCHFTMPDSLTTYRITAFGVNNDLFALQEDEVKVQNPVNVSVVKPLKLRERDTAETGVLITNLHKDGLKVEVSLDVSGAENIISDTGDGLAVTPGAAFVDGENKRSVYVAGGDSAVVYFDLAAQKEGTVELKFHIKSDILNETITDTIPIEKTYVYEKVATVGSLYSSDKEASEKIIIPGIAKDGRGDLEITLDATRLGLLGGGVNYVFDYPYGCIEQHTARLLPLIAFDEYIDVFGLDNKVKNVRNLVCNYMKEIAKAQKSSGGFPYWPDSSYENLFVSMRVLNLYQLGLERGYTKAELAINADILMDYIFNQLKEDSEISYSNYTKVLACYYLSKAGRTGLDNVLNSLYKDLDNQPLSNIAYIGLAYFEKGDSEKVEKCLKTIKRYLVPSNRSVSVTKKDGDYDFWENENDKLAVLLKFLVMNNPEDEMVDRLIYTLMNKQRKGYWQNTVTTANVLDAFYTYSKERNLDETDFLASVKLDGKEIMTGNFNGVDAKAKTLTFPFEKSPLSDFATDKNHDLSFIKNGKGNLYYTTMMSYALPDENQAARNEGVNLNFEIRDYETEELMNPENAATNEIKLESGRLYKATVKLSSIRNLDYLALRTPVPSGAEILDSTFVTTGDEGEIQQTSSTYWGHRISNKTILANEIQFFWDNFSTGETSVTFTFRATRRGVYPLPPAQAECMYEPEIFGRSSGALVEIK